MVKEFYFLQRCDSPQVQKFESLISFHAQDEYGSKLGEEYHNIICKPDLIHISQEYDHTIELVYKYLQHISFCHLTQHAYQLPTIFFLKLIGVVSGFDGYFFGGISDIRGMGSHILAVQNKYI